MKKRYLVIFVLIILGITSFSTFATNRSGAIALTLGAGNYYFSSKRHLDNATIPFLGLGYDFTDYWGIEALGGIFHTNSEQPELDGKQVNGSLFLVDGVYHFTPYKMIQPFVLAGVGILGLSPNGSDARNEGNINAGAGIQIFANKSIALRLEARDLYTIVGGKNDVLLDAGVIFLFDLF